MTETGESTLPGEERGSALPTFPRKSLPPTREGRPDWFKVPFPGGPRYLQLRRLVREERLHTVCEEAHCPNIGECWQHGTATLMLLGDTCTRACGFCAVATGRPGEVDDDEPNRVARTVRTLGLRHAVLTSVTRDDLPDGGAAIFAASIRRIRESSPGCAIEVLIPDLMGNWEALATIVAASPEVLNHNTETVPRLYGRVRPKAVYRRSLELLRHAKGMGPDLVTKSGVMVGLGEGEKELTEVFSDLRSVGVDVLTIGQYLRPSAWHLPIARYYTPAEFQALRVTAETMGFRHVESGPLVRSSYHAYAMVQ
ncbi:MAG: lipA [Chloroflexi bacterium]|nr:lipA [Chloroflexota bacterium]